MKLFPPTWQHHHLMIAFTTVSLIQWQLIFFLGVDQYTKANLTLDASQALFVVQGGKGHTSFAAASDCRTIVGLPWMWT